MPRRLRAFSTPTRSIIQGVSRGSDLNIQGVIQGVRPKQKLSCDPVASMLRWSACHDDYAFNTPTRFIMSWPAVMGVITSCATTLIAIGFRNSLVKRRFAVPGMSTRSRSCPITCTLCSKLRSLTSAVACSRFSRRMPMDGRVVTAFPDTSFQGRYSCWSSWKMRRISGRVTRYVHLNPCPGRAGGSSRGMGLVEVILVMPTAAAAWSGWLTTSCWHPGVAHLAEPTRQGRTGGTVTAGMSEPPQSPWNEAYHGWILRECRIH